MSKPKPQRDPRGHSLRVYSDVYDSPAFAALSPHDVLAYLALLRELKGYNNGDLSLPLSRAKTCGVSHSKTLARSLRALCAVGLVAVTRKGGCNKGGQRLPNLYRMTDRECYAIPAKHLEAMPETNDWKRITSAQHGYMLIQVAEDAAKSDALKKNNLGHAVTGTTSLRALVAPKTRAPSDAWNERPGHVVRMEEKASNLAHMRSTAEFSASGEKVGHRAPRMPPLYLYQSQGQLACSHERGSYQRLTTKPAHLFARLMYSTQTTH